MSAGPSRSESASTLSRLYWSAFTLLQMPGALRLPFVAPVRLAALQDRRVREMVAYAYATVPFYRDAMGERGLRPADFKTAADLAKLPVVRGRDLARDPRRFLSTAVAGEPLLELTTSGSTGDAKRIWWDRAAVFRSFAAGLTRRHVRAEMLGRLLVSRSVYVGPRDPSWRLVYAFKRTHAFVPSIPGRHWKHTHPEESFERNLEIINSAKPELITGFGAYIGAIYRWAQASGHEIARPRLITYGGEHLPEADRKFLETDLGIPVASLYQACEAFQIAFQCPRREGLHIHLNLVAVRIADEQGETLPPGRRGRIVISTLTNRATVLLNYDIGDLGSMAADPCACGRTLPMLASLDGREDDLVVLPGGQRVHDSVILSTLYDIPGVVRLQIVQEALDGFRIRAVRAPERAESELRRDLVESFSQIIGPHVRDVAVEFVADIATGPSGKFKSILSHVLPPASPS